MSKKEKIKILIAIGILIILFFGFFWISYEKPEEVSSPPDKNFLVPASGVNKTSSAILEINGIKYESEITGQISVYDFMDKLQNEGKINFTEKNYMGMGKFIVSINGTKDSGDQNWIYYVNGTEAQVGVSNYKIKAGDIVSWKYEKANY